MGAEEGEQDNLLGVRVAGVKEKRPQPFQPRAAPSGGEKRKDGKFPPRSRKTAGLGQRQQFTHSLLDRLPSILLWGTLQAGRPDAATTQRSRAEENKVVSPSRQRQSSLSRTPGLSGYWTWSRNPSTPPPHTPAHGIATAVYACWELEYVVFPVLSMPQTRPTLPG